MPLFGNKRTTEPAMTQVGSHPTITTGAHHTTAPTTTRSNHGNNTTHYKAIYLTMFALGATQMGLLGHLISKINDDELQLTGNVSARLKYSLFVAVWTTILSLVFLVLAMVARKFAWKTHVAFLIATSALWLISAALLEDVLGEFTCAAFLARGICRELRATRILSWVLFALPFLATFLVRSWRHKERAAVRNNNAAYTHNNTATPVVV